MATAAGKFRKCFKGPSDRISWYPGHMNSSFKHMQALMRNVDCVVEVHDSRIPISGRNPKFLFSLIGYKPHILVLNKKDLIDRSNCEVIKEKCLEDECANVIFTNCLDKSCGGLRQIVPLAVNLIQGKGIHPGMTGNYTMMVVGVPNVGKSSLINALRNISLARGKASPVGPHAGVTKSVLTKIKISTEPPIFLIDTPGILMPSISDVECGMKLALCSCLKDSVVGETVIADFLLYWLNKTENFIYVDYFGLPEPVDDIFTLLTKIAVDQKKMKKVKNIVNNSIECVPNIEDAAKYMISLFRKGIFGDLSLDKNLVSV